MHKGQSDSEKVEFEDRLVENFCCAKCHGKSAVTKHASMTRGLPDLLTLSHDKYILLICTLCGYTELYSCLAFANEKEAAEAPQPLVPEA